MKVIYSVIVPAYNAASTIGKCLDALLGQTIKNEFYEIIVVDDGSIDRTADLVKAYERVRLIRQRNQGPAAARNRGAKEACGDVLLFTDSDCIPMPNWMAEMSKPFNQDAEIVATKGVYVTNQRQIVARFVQLEYEDKYDLMKRDRYIDFIDTYSAAFRRDVFLQFGGYDQNFPVACAEDVEFSYRLSNKGCKMVFVPLAVVSHIHPDSLNKYLKKKYKFAYWRVFALRGSRSKIMRDSHTPQTMKAQILILLSILFAFVLSPFFSNLLWLAFGFVLLYLMTSVPFAIKSLQRDLKPAIMAPMLLFLRSLAQLAGLLAGAIGRIRRPVGA